MRRLGQELGHSGEVVGGEGEVKSVFGALEPSEPGLSPACDGLEPSENLLGPFADAHRYGVILMAGGSPVDVGSAPRLASVILVLSDMGRDPVFAQFGHKVSGIEAVRQYLSDHWRSIVSLACQGAAGAEMFVRQVDARQAFRQARGPRQSPIDHKPVAIFHQRRADKTETRRLAGRLFVEPSVRISGRCMGFVRPLLAPEIALGIAPAALAVIAGASFGRKLFMLAQASICVPSTEK